MKPLILSLMLVILLLAACDNAPQAVTEATGQPTATAPAATATTAATVAPSPTTVPPTATATPTEPPTATPTDEPTATVEPTATPSPSPEPPTATPTAAPSATPRPLPPATTVAATSAPAADAAILRQQISDAITALGHYRGSLGRGFRNEGMGHVSTTGEVDCRVIVDNHDRILNVIALDVSGSTPTVQNAFATAQQGVASFAAIATAWTDGCRQALALGNATNVIHQQQFTELWNRFAEPDNLWNQAYHMLDE